MAHFLVDYGPEHHLSWVTFIIETGECWTFTNPDVRLWTNVTEGRDKVTPFSKSAIARHRRKSPIK